MWSYKLAIYPYDFDGLLHFFSDWPIHITVGQPFRGCRRKFLDELYIKDLNTHQDFDPSSVCMVPLYLDFYADIKLDHNYVSVVLITSAMSKSYLESRSTLKYIYRILLESIIALGLLSHVGVV